MIAIRGPAPALVALVEDVAERPAVGDDAPRPFREPPVDHAVLGDHTSQEQLGDDLDDPRAADACDAGLRDPRREFRLVGPRVDTDDPDPRLKRLAIDPDALDGARRRSLTAGDLGAFESRSRGTRGRKKPAPVAQHDLGVRADIDDERHPLREVGLLGEDDARRVGTDVARDARQHIDPCPRVSAKSQLGGRRPYRPIRREGEWRTAERRRVDAQQQVMHDRVADDRQLEDLGPLDAGPHRERGDEPVERLAHRGGHLSGTLGMHHRVRDPAHEVLAEPDLRVHHAVAGEHRPVGQIGEMPGDRRRPDIDRDAVRRLVQTGPDRR